jgi:uncharacterized iron-regulated protein
MAYSTQILYHGGMDEKLFSRFGRSSVFLPLAFVAACQFTPPPLSAQSAADATRLAVARAPLPSPSAVAASTKAVDLHTLPDLAAILPQLAEDRVVFVGERHTNYSDHLSQLAIIRGLHERRPDLAIGMEYFQQPFQQYLDEYVAGTLSETDLLAKSQYFTRWGYDFRLYEPILKYARENRIPLVALNLPSEIVQKVGQSGLAGLTEQERAAIPRHLDRSNPAYREYLQSVFKDHPRRPGADFENFLDAQLLWDEGMAARAAGYLEEHPARALVVLAGIGHVQYGFGIPDRLTRRIDVSRAILVNGLGESFQPNVADFVLLTTEVRLPPPGTLGVMLEPGSEGLRLASFARDSAARAAGLEAGDRIVSLNGGAVKDLSDVKLVLWNKQPGDRVRVGVKRESWLLGGQELSFEVTLR